MPGRGGAAAGLLFSAIWISLAARRARGAAPGLVTFFNQFGKLAHEDDVGLGGGGGGGAEAAELECQGRGTLRPSDLPGHRVFTDWQGGANETVRLPGYATPLEVAHGSIVQSAASAGGGGGGAQLTEQASAGAGAKFYGGGGREARFSVIKGIVSRAEIRGMLKILTRVEAQFDTDPDSVDGMPTFEIYTEKPDAEWESNELASSALNVVGTPKRGMGSDPLRRLLQNRARAILAERITPYVRQAFPHACGRGMGRACTPCYSLIRRYREGERQSHGVHHDGHAIVTVVVSLSEYGVDYRGGLYVTTSRGQKRFLALRKGDAVVHQSDLYHGVKVLPLLPSRDGEERIREGDEHNNDAEDDEDGEDEEIKIADRRNKRRRRKRRRRRRRHTTTAAAAEGPDSSATPNKAAAKKSKKEEPKAKKTTAKRTAGSIFFQAQRAAGAHAAGQTKRRRVVSRKKKKGKKSITQAASVAPPTTSAKTERWSWILWYRDSDTCEDHGHERFEECAQAGVAVCQKLYATKLGTRPQGGNVNDVLLWNQKAADGGDATAAVKIARAYLGLLPSPLTKSPAKA